MNKGVNFTELKNRFPSANTEKYATSLVELSKQGLLEISGDNIKLTQLGRLYADTVAVELL